MYYVYVLHSSKDGKFYTGYTSDLRRRYNEHINGYNFSTKYRLPLKLIYYGASASEIDAKRREKYLKSGMGKRYIRNRLKFYLNIKDF